MYEITEADLLLVKRVISKCFGIKRDSVIYDDAVSIGNEALLKARNIFDPSYNTKFSTLAYGIVFKDILSFINSAYGREFYLSKVNLFDNEDTEDVLEYKDTDTLELIENEERIEQALTILRSEPRESTEVLVAYLSGVDYKDTITRLGISKDKYYRTIIRLLKKVEGNVQ